MSVNSTSSALQSSNSSLHPPLTTCFRSQLSIVFFTVFSVINLLLLPLFFLVLYLGYQQRRRQRSTSTAAASQSDLFIYQSIIMHPIVFLGFTLFFWGGYISQNDMMMVGLCVWSVASVGQALFHILTCGERYLAVVHPITYLGLRSAEGVRIRNISTGGVWLLSFGWIAVLYFTSNQINTILYCCSTAFFLIIICFCSISVLYALKRPGPGDMGGNRERVDQSKQRAFHNIMAIMGVLLLRFGGNLISNVIYISAGVNPGSGCVMNLSAFWLDLPSSLVLPLLFLHRTGKLNC